MRFELWFLKERIFFDTAWNIFLDNFLPIQIQIIWNCKSLVCFSTAMTTFDEIIKINMADIRQLLNTFFFTFYSFPFSSVKMQKKKKIKIKKNIFILPNLFACIFHLTKKVICKLQNCLYRSVANVMIPVGVALRQI